MENQSQCSTLDDLIIDGHDVDQNVTCDIEGGEDDHGDSIAGTLWSSSRDFYSSSSGSGEGTVGVMARWDFLAMLTTVCEAYRHGTYLRMMMLNSRQWQPLGAGTTFRVSRPEMQLTAFSSRDHRRRQTVSNRLVMKRNDYRGDMTAAQIRNFIKELRVLHHMSAHPYIVDLRGVGWFEEIRDESSRSFKPAVILEEAFDTLDYLMGSDASVVYDIMLEIFGQITSGLRGLHSCGIVHGDLKPGNILLFKRLVVRGSVQIESFTAKLSDFESVAYQAEEVLSAPPGTPGFRAPEIDEARASGWSSASFADLVLADAWSLGIVFAVVLSGTQDSLRNEHPDERVRQLFREVKRKLESSTAESEHSEVALDVLKHTMRIDPSKRHLDEVERLLAPFLEGASRKQYVTCTSSFLTYTNTSTTWLCLTYLCSLDGTTQVSCTRGSMTALLSVTKA